MALLGRIARSLDRSTQKGRAARRITWVCSAVCFAVMTIALSVQRGFEESITDRIGLLGGDCSLSPQPWAGEAGPEAIDEQEWATVRGAERVMAVEEQPVVVQAGGNIRGAILRRAEAQQLLRWLEPVWVVRPQEADWAQSAREELPLVVSATLARRLGLEQGTQVEVLVFSDSVLLPLKTIGRVAGVYSTAIETAEEPLVFGLVAALDAPTGYVLRGRSIDHSALETLGGTYGWQVVSVEEQAPELFDWLAMLRSNMLLVVVVILAVGLVNLTGSVLIFILEGTSTIALLAALGLSQRRIQRMFLWRSLSVVAAGAAWGVGLGVAAAVVQHYTGVVGLNAADYFVEALPMAIIPTEWAVLTLGALGLIGLAVWGATYTLGRIRPAAALTYE